MNLVENINLKQWDYYSIMKDAKLIFNGHDRFEIRNKETQQETSRALLSWALHDVCFNFFEMMVMND